MPKLASFFNPPPHKGPIPMPQLSDRQRADLDVLRSYFGRHNYALPLDEQSDELAPLSDREMMWLSQETLLRFRNATKTGVADTISRIERAIVWRRSVGMDNVEGLAEALQDEWRTGCAFTMGFTPHRRPVVYLFPNRNTLAPEERSIELALFMIERAIDMMTDGQTQMTIIWSFTGKRLGKMSSVATIRRMLSVYSEYYPDISARVLFMDVPWFAKTFLKIIWPFVDPRTKANIKFSQGEEAIAKGELDEEQTLVECGGNLDVSPVLHQRQPSRMSTDSAVSSWVPYDHDSMCPTLIHSCLELRHEQLKRWLDLGTPEVGRPERLFKVSSPYLPPYGR